MCSSRTRSTRGVRQRRGDCPRSSATTMKDGSRSEEHTSELQSQSNLVCRLLLEKKNGSCRSVALMVKSSTRSCSRALSRYDVSSEPTRPCHVFHFVADLGTTHYMATSWDPYWL